jgi:hypothetical protein
MQPSLAITKVYWVFFRAGEVDSLEVEGGQFDKGALIYLER